MKRLAMLNLALCACFALPITAMADELDWTTTLGLRGNADLGDFKVALGTRFKIGDTKVNFLISNVDRPEDSYMVLRLSELSNRPVEDVLKVYKTDHGRGWGSMARRLGIKPGSREFHDFKTSHEIYRGRDLRDPAEVEAQRQTIERPGHHRGHGRGKHKG